MTKFNTMGN